MEVPFLDLSQINEIADEERQKHADFACVPVDIERILELNLGFQLDVVDELRDQAGVDALLLTGPLLKMAVDREQYYEPRFWARLRFSMAHELGHHILHVARYPVFKGLRLSSVDDWLSFYDKIPLEQHFHLERQANQFAGRFLVPRNDLVEAFELAKSRFPSAVNLDDQKLDEICLAIGKKFNVSTDCIRQRIQWEKLYE